MKKKTYNGLINGKINNHTQKQTHIIGTHTTFLTDITAGKYIVLANKVANQPTQLYRYKVKTIVSDGELELDSNVANITNAQLYIGKLQGKFVRNIATEKYVVLSLSNANFERIDSSNVNIQNSFAILPILNQFKQPWPDEKRFALTFENTLPNIEYLDIRFTDYHGNLIDFNGMEHILMFAITTVQNNNIH